MHDGDVDVESIAMQMRELRRHLELERLHPYSKRRRSRDGDHGGDRRVFVRKEERRVVDLLDVGGETRPNDGSGAENIAGADNRDTDHVGRVHRGLGLQEPLWPVVGDGDGVGEGVSSANLGCDRDAQFTALALRLRRRTSSSGYTQTGGARALGRGATLSTSKETLSALDRTLPAQQRRVLDEANPPAIPRLVFDLFVDDDPRRHLGDADEPAG
mmetsp:Transcript_24149/g.75524  ORF Transcript_24149/g.75524 Transcript_24149/m.75524 type:complete len:215 (+) Transcript_24149:2383-3027(+)